MTDISEDKFKIIAESFKREQFDIAIQESCKVFEVLMKRLYIEAISKFDSKSRRKLIECEYAQDKNSNGIDSFTFGEVIGLYRSCDFFAQWGRQTGRDPAMLKAINFDAINRLRNASSHKVKGQEIDFNSANFVFRNLEHFIALLGYTEYEKYISAFTDKAPNSSRLTRKTQKQPDLSRAQNLYDVLDKSEQRRLEFQRSLLRDDDIEILKNISRGADDLSLIDIGCNDGGFIYDRVKHISQITRVIGVDKNETIIQAQDVKDSRFSFYQADCNSNKFEEEVEKIAKSEGIEKFDLAVVSMVLLHLKQPFKALKAVRRALRKGGSIFVRDMDDGLALAHPDPKGIVERANRISREIPGTGFRNSGREIYSLLKRTGFRDIKLHPSQVDTIGMDFDQRELLFNINFSFIRADLHDAARSEPDKYGEDWEWFREAYEDLEELFQSEEFYYRMGTMVFTATK
mgnify:CR=1 FL=1